MKSRRGLVASFSSAFTVLLVFTAWVLFAPPQLGGQTSYVIINGNSMEPGMHRGDLAIVRKANSYAVGDVVTYQHPQIGPVIHRVIDRDGARYVLQGDNNDFIDPYHPAQEELIGELWIHVPNLGSWLARFREPVYMAGLLCVAFIGFGGTAARKAASKTPDRAGRPTTNARRAGNSTGGQPMNQLLRNWQDTVSALAAVGIALVGLGWVAFHRPTHHEVPANIPYSQSGEFAYTAVPLDGRVYDTGVASTGEPVYRRLSDQVAFRFDYEFDATEAASAVGNYRMVAELGDSNGWKRTIELTPKTEFSGSKFSAEGVLNLAEVLELTTVLEEQSGVKNEKYSVTVRPSVEIAGSIGGTVFEDKFSPELPMSLDKVQLKLDQSSNNETPITPRLDGLVSTLKQETNSIKLLVLTIPVAAARAISMAGIGLVLALGGWLLISAVRESQAAAKTPTFGRRSMLRSPLVNVRGSVPTPRTRVVDVASLEDLGRIATKIGAVVLQEARPGYHAFFVHDMELTYRYEAVGKAADAAAEQSRPGRVA